jgi:hypothetical protein
MEVVPFQEQQDPDLRLGEGRSRTSAATAQLFELKIWLPGQGAMRDLVRAESLKVVVPATAAIKHKLARAKNGPRETARRRLKLVEKRNEPADC